MARGLGALDAFTEGQVSIPRVHMAAHSYLSLQVQDIMTTSGLCRYHTHHRQCADVHIAKTLNRIK